MTLFLLLLVISALICILFQAKKIKFKDWNLALAKTAIDEQTLAAAAREAQLQGDVDQLSQYQPILDAEQYATQVRTKAEGEAATVLTRARREADDLRTAAADELKQSRTESKDIRDQAGVRARVLQTQADGVLLDATKEAARIITIANQRGEEIAGEALAAARNAAGLEKTIQALKNVIDGYGDQYLIPSYVLLDELADEFGYTQAGEELKRARERTRLMMSTRMAAKCDYVEVVRSTSAVNFVTDAFNGKVVPC